jgi:hypothetical protein
MNNEEQQFLDYCWRYYGEDGIWSDRFSRDEMLLAHQILTLFSSKIGVEHCLDTFSRELVRDICLYRRGEIFIEYQSFIEELDKLIDIRSISLARLNKLMALA